MSDNKLPIIHKAPVEGIRMNVARAGLAIGDEAQIDRLSDGRIGVFARVRKPLFGVFTRRKTELLGHLGPMAEDLLSLPLSQGSSLRIRIVDLLPEHLANGYPPEVYISVWGDPRHISPFLGIPAASAAQDGIDAAEDQQVVQGKAARLPRIHPA
ncbi:MAG: hypothetical protein HC844_15595 [Tabrizicola sp.]|nr:hypothetical protein [Tabrizicola sp.]